MRSCGIELGLIRLGEADLALTLNYDFLINSGSSMSQAVRRGPVPVFTRASDARSFNSVGILVAVGGNDLPRFNHDPANSNARLGLLIEEARTNLALQSEGVAAPWMKFGALSISINNDPAPDGTMTADRIVDISTGAFQALQQDISISTALLPWIWSVYCNKQAFDTFPEFQFIMTGGVGITATAQLDLQTGATAIRVDPAGAGLTIAVEELANHWRYSMTMTNTGGNNVVQIGILPAASNSTLGALNSNAVGGVGVWGHQLEQASFATSYIPTTTASVARAKDIDSVNVSSLLGAANTLIVAARTGFGPGVVVQIDDGTENERYRIERNSSNELRLFVTDGGAEQVGASGLNLGTVADNTDFKVAVRLAANDFASSLDGAAVVTDTSGTLPTVTTLRAGMDTVDDYWNAPIANIKLYNVGKPSTFLVSETT